MNEATKPEVAHDRPAQLDYLLLREVLPQLVVEGIVDVLVVDEEALGEVERRLFLGRKVSVAPAPDPGNGFLFQGFSSP